MSPTLHIKLLGDFKLVYETKSITSINTARLQFLLAYLLLHRDTPQSRQHLAFLFWPDSSETQARTNLRQTLHHLRHALPAESFLQTSARTLQWRPDAPFILDVAEFEDALAQADQAKRQADQTALRVALERAAGLYGGDLLPGCYDDWVLGERERLREQGIAVLERLTQLLEEQRDYAPAIRHAQYLLRIDPLREATYRRLMRLHALNDDRAGALRVYHTGATLLQRELGVAPAPATREVYERLLHNDPSSIPQLLVQASASPLIGRGPEWARLQAAWRTATSGHPHLVLIAGEAGIGKTRLAEELLQWASRQGITTAKTRCYAAEGRLAYGPVIEWLRGEALKTATSRLDTIWITEIARLLPELLTECPNLPRPEPLTDNWQRRHLFEALARVVLTADPPLLLVIDDLQWCDRESLEWLHYLLRFDFTARLLIIGTVRAEEINVDHPLTTLLADLKSNGPVTEIALEPLDTAATAALAAQVTDRELDADRLARLYRQTEGNPLFVVESVRAGLTAGDNGSPPLPPKVHAVITARLHQLSPPARALAGLAATVGQAFSFEVLARASDYDEDALVRGLDELWQRRIVREQGEAYDFSHDKIREVAYAELSPVRRRLLHRRVAQALEELNPLKLDTISAQLAAHYDRAGLPKRAIPHYQCAAAVAQRIFANEQAIGLLNRALTLLDTLPGDRERDELELALQTALGVSLVAARGYGASEVRQTYLRAHMLCQQLGKPPDPPVLRALAIAYVVGRELNQAQMLGDQLLTLAQAGQDPILRVEAHYVLGVTLFWRGELVAARENLEQALAHYDLQGHRLHISLYAQDPRIICLSRLAFDLWYLGYPEQALGLGHQALALAQELAHPFSLAYAMHWLAWLYQHCRPIRTAQTQAEASIAFSTEQGFPYWFTQGTILRGWTLLEQGRMESGIAQMREGLATFKATGTEVGRPYYLGLLARAWAKTGQTEQGLDALDEALAIVNNGGERWPEAELYRLKGELLLSLGNRERQAEDSLNQALAVARRQQARSLELRAVLSLSRLWRKQGRQEQARARLAEIYGWFTEGLDTPDLIEAGRLLRELS